MPRMLITGMSAVGKSSTIARLAAVGYQAVDLDTPEWSHLVPDDSEYADDRAGDALDWRWREDEVRALLTSAGTLFVSGTSTYQARLYPLLEHIVLLSVPEDVARHRLATRVTNDYGKNPAELERELSLRGVVEPALRRSACLELDTARHPVEDVADIVAAHLPLNCRP